MSDLRIAARAALDALDSYAKSAYIRHQHPVKFAKGIAAANDLRAALARPEQQALKPCRSPYCECAQGECTHPGFYDARGTTPQESAPRFGITLDLAQKIARDCRATRLGEPLPDSLLNLVR